MARRFLLLFAIALTGLTLVAAGCGGDDEESAAEDVPALTETTEEAMEEEATEETTTEEATEEESTEEDSGDTSGSPFISGNCQGLAEATQNFSTDFTSGNVDFEKFADEFQQFADGAPSEIKGDLQTLADAYSKYADALQGVDLTSTTPDPEALQKLSALATEIDAQELSQASTNVAAWVTSNCS